MRFPAPLCGDSHRNTKQQQRFKNLEQLQNWEMKEDSMRKRVAGKRAVALVMASLMMTSMVGCGGKGAAGGSSTKVNDDGTISFPEGKTASDCGYGMAEGYWIVPYSGNTYPLDVNGPTFFEDLIQFNKDSLRGPAFGFDFDITNVVDQYTACSNIMDKYYKALLSGSVDVESTIEQANAEMEAAGLNDIIAEKQAQLDAFLAQ